MANANYRAMPTVLGILPEASENPKDELLELITSRRQALAATNKKLTDQQNIYTQCKMELAQSKMLLAHADGKEKVAKLLLQVQDHTLESKNY